MKKQEKCCGSPFKKVFFKKDIILDCSYKEVTDQPKKRV